MPEKTSDQDFINALYGELKAKNGHTPGPKHSEGVSRTYGFKPSPPKNDDEIIELCRRADNAAKFARLFDSGDTGEYAGDDSAADFALLGILKLYTQDPEQLDRIMRRSTLKRDKWDASRA